MAAVGAHPHIVRYHLGWLEAKGEGTFAYLQMELCAESLGTQLAVHGQPCREAALLTLLAQVQRPQLDSVAAPAAVPQTWLLRCLVQSCAARLRSLAVSATDHSLRRSPLPHRAAGLPAHSLLLTLDMSAPFGWCVEQTHASERNASV